MTVVAFKDNILPSQPVQGVIDELESLLAEAKSGDLRAIGYCTVRENSKGTGWAGDAGTSEGLATAVSMLQHRFIAALLEGHE